MSDPKKSDALPAAAVRSSDSIHGVKLDNDAFQVFKTPGGAVNFLTVGVSCVTWSLASAYTGWLIKCWDGSMPQPSSSKFRFMIMAAKTLSPTEDSCICNGRSYHSFCAMLVLGPLPGALIVRGWFRNTHCAIIQGDFRSSHAGCHSIGDMAEMACGLWLKGVTGVFFLATYIIVFAPGIFGTSVALKAWSNHAVCANYFMLVATALVFLMSSIRKFAKIAWLIGHGFLSGYIAVFIVVYGYPQ